MLVLFNGKKVVIKILMMSHRSGIERIALKIWNIFVFFKGGKCHFQKIKLERGEMGHGPFSTFYAINTTSLPGFYLSVWGPQCSAGKPVLNLNKIYIYIYTVAP